MESHPSSFSTATLSLSDSLCEVVSTKDAVHRQWIRHHGHNQRVQLSSSCETPGAKEMESEWWMWQEYRVQRGTGWVIGSGKGLALGGSDPRRDLHQAALIENLQHRRQEERRGDNLKEWQITNFLFWGGNFLISMFWSGIQKIFPY
ncbi:hypothetical protein FCM35_KLT21274 [Carex littledalei]|uniref:Uncharacterized protein n=1 Tax=Carex littledalei TaxID=544730 RepID=A0A833QUK7_9POAL|nr:hypothetical protein FCM35_KLT21274 [Carex littledalei]